MEAINLAGSTVGVLAEAGCRVSSLPATRDSVSLGSQDGVVLAGEKKTTSKLLDQAKQHEKLFQPLSTCQEKAQHLFYGSSNLGWTMQCSACALRSVFRCSARRPLPLC